MKKLQDTFFFICSFICSVIVSFILGTVFGILLNENVGIISAIVSVAITFPFLFYYLRKKHTKKILQKFIDTNYNQIQTLYNMGTYVDLYGKFHGEAFIEHFNSLICQEFDLFYVANKEKIFQIAFTLYKNKSLKKPHPHERAYLDYILSEVKYLNELKKQLYLLTFECFKKHKETLYQKYTQLVYVDDYGNTVNEAFFKELEYFYDNILEHNLIDNKETAALTEMEPILLIGCDTIDNSLSTLFDMRYEDIEHWCEEKIRFRCNGNLVELNEEYLKSIKQLNTTSYMILENAINNAKGKKLDLKKSISEFSFFENTPLYLETLKKLTFCTPNFKTFFNKKNIVSLCFLFTQLYDKKQHPQKKQFTNNTPSNPYEFEKLCANLLEEQGFKTKVTKKSGDQGVDVLAQKDNKTFAIQCKFYHHPIGNKAVQEINAGKTYYKTDYAVVVSTNTYTTSAKQLAKNCGVYLLNIEDLKRLDEIVSNQHDS